MIFGYWSSGDGAAAFKCFRCGSAFKMTAVQFNGLPSLTAAEERDLGLAPPPVPDAQEQGGTTPPLTEVSNA